MKKEPTPQQIRRRRRAAFELCSRTADLLDDAARLDGDPAMRVLATDIEKIAAHLGIPAERLTEAVTALWPRHPDNTEGDKS